MFINPKFDYDFFTYKDNYGQHFEYDITCHAFQAWLHTQYDARHKHLAQELFTWRF